MKKSTVFKFQQKNVSHFVTTFIALLCYIGIWYVSSANLIHVKPLTRTELGRNLIFFCLKIDHNLPAGKP